MNLIKKVKSLDLRSGLLKRKENPVIPLPREKRQKSISRWFQDREPERFKELKKSGGLKQAIEEKDQAMMQDFEEGEDRLMEDLMKRKVWGTEEGLKEQQTRRH